MSTTVDAIATALYELLRDAADKPAGLGSDQVLDHDLLPATEDDLPVVGVYLVEDNLDQMSDSAGGEQRTAKFRVEIRTIGKMLAATKPLRDWVLATLIADTTLTGLAESVDFSGFKPFGVTGDNNLVGADLDFEIRYFWSPE